MNPSLKAQQIEEDLRRLITEQIVTMNENCKEEVIRDIWKTLKSDESGKAILRLGATAAARNPKIVAKTGLKTVGKLLKFRKRPSVQTDTEAWNERRKKSFAEEARDLVRRIGELKNKSDQEGIIQILLKDNPSRPEDSEKIVEAVADGVRIFTKILLSSS